MTVIVTFYAGILNTNLLSANVAIFGYIVADVILYPSIATISILIGEFSGYVLFVLVPVLLICDGSSIFIVKPYSGTVGVVQPPVLLVKSANNAYTVRCDIYFPDSLILEKCIVLGAPEP